MFKKTYAVEYSNSFTSVLGNRATVHAYTAWGAARIVTKRGYRAGLHNRVASVLRVG